MIGRNVNITSVPTGSRMGNLDGQNSIRLALIMHHTLLNNISIKENSATRRIYGDMLSFIGKLRAMGYEKVELIDTTTGMFMSPWEAKWMALSGSGLLVGKK